MVFKELKHISKIDNANTIGDMRNLQVQREVSNRIPRKCLNRNFKEFIKKLKAYTRQPGNVLKKKLPLIMCWDTHAICIAVTSIAREQVQSERSRGMNVDGPWN